MKLKTVNLTTHDITEVTTGKKIPRSGRVARVNGDKVKVAEHNGMPIYQSTVTGVEGIPEPEEGTLFIVSSLTLNYVPDDRLDIVAPGNVQRDQNKNPIGCTGFRRKG